MKRQLLVAFAALSVSTVTPATPFTGSWDDGIQIVMVQRGAAVCGLWSYRATNSYYEGLFVGKAVGTRLSIEYMCGDPGGTVSTPCPGEGAVSRLPDKSWERKKFGALSCAYGLHFEEDEANLPFKCNLAQKRSALKRQEKKAEAANVKSLQKYISEEPAFAACSGT